MVTYSLVDTIGIIAINNPPVNALSRQVRAGLLEALATARTDASRAVLLMCEGSTFIAGADISELGKPPQAPALSEVLAALEDFPKLVVAAIHGRALGGGLETALVCHYRCATPTAVVGLPEVRLGLLPGAGGTQRLPRIAGVALALDMMTSGNPLPAPQACARHIIDEIIEGDLPSGALAYVRRLLSEGAPLRRIRDIPLSSGSVDSTMVASYRTRLARRSRGQIAPDRIVSCVEAALNLPFDAGLERERELFLECLASPQSRALRHVFFAEREAPRILDLPAGTPLRQVRSVAIIGGGTMGAGIAMCVANVGIPVVLLEISDEALDRGLDRLRKHYASAVGKSRMTEEEAQACLQRIAGSTQYSDLGAADLVIEAVFEDPIIKQEVFRRLDAVCKPGAILASNTSYQNIDALAAQTRRPQDVVGMHFFSPANVMKLLEVVRGEHTADDVLATVMALGKNIGKVCVLARVCYGFIGNRMLTGYLRQAHRLLLEGATPARIDAVAESFGMAMGPLAVSDLAGLDVGYKARMAREAEGERLDPRSHCISSALVELGRLGQKSGAGYYRYEAQTREPQPDPEVDILIQEQADRLGIVRREIGNDEILARLLYPLINEGARILEEGIAQRPGDIDIVYVYGYGFPGARGGPMHHADEIGLARIHDTICRFRDSLGAEDWQPATLLARLARENSSFAAFGSAEAQ